MESGQSANSAKEISIVIASKVGQPFVDECIESIKAEVEALGAEAIVVAAGSDQYAARIAKKFPWVRVIHVPPSFGIPACRSRGVEEAQGDIVAVIEEHCLAAPD